MLKIDFENQILSLFDVYFWPFNKSRKKINTIFFSQCNHSFNDEKLSSGTRRKGLVQFRPPLKAGPPLSKR